jgi:hypothetical protein
LDIPEMNQHYLAICAIFRDEAPYLAEWISFHQLVGVEHFYLYNNNSSDGYLGVIQPFIDSGAVTLLDWPVPFHEWAQRKAYEHCLEAARAEARWLAFIDIDEFLFAPQNESLKDVLPGYESWPGVVVNWQTYGSSGHRMMSATPVIERFEKRAATNWVRNRKVKSIVQPARTLAPTGVHHFDYLGGLLPVDENQNPVSWKRRTLQRKKLKRWFGKMGWLLNYFDPYSAADISGKKVSVKKLRINHYPVKSYEEFCRKSTLKKEKRRYEYIDYFAYHDRNEIHDPVMQRFLPALNKKLKMAGKD